MYAVELHMFVYPGFLLKLNGVSATDQECNSLERRWWSFSPNNLLRSTRGCAIKFKKHELISVVAFFGI
jgi:hypothetical protein